MTRVHPHRTPALIALAIALIGLSLLLLVDHGPWNKPRIERGEMVYYSTTTQAARAVGATVTPTAPKSGVEPVAPGPKPVQPAIPEVKS